LVLAYTFDQVLTLSYLCLRPLRQIPPSLQPALREIAERVARFSQHTPGSLPRFHDAVGAGVGAARSMSGGAAAAMQGAAHVMLERMSKASSSAQSAANVVVVGAQGAAVAFKDAAQRLPQGAASAMIGGISIARDVAGSFASDGDVESTTASKTPSKPKGNEIIRQAASHVHNFSSQ
jgi:hypothetical protein